MYYHDTIIRPRYAETDQMGVIHHANYFLYFECGRSDMMRDHGYSYKKLEDAGIIMPLIDVACKYKKPVLYDEEIIIRTSIDYIKGIRIAFKYEVLRRSDLELLAVGQTVHGFVNKELKPVKYSKLDESFRNILEKLK